MAFVTDIRMGGTSIFSRLASLRDDVANRYAKYRTYRNTLNELRALSTRELDDLGLNAERLEQIAFESAYS